MLLEVVCLAQAAKHVVNIPKCPAVFKQVQFLKTTKGDNYVHPHV